MSTPERIPEPIRALLDELWAQGIRDERVLEALAHTPRERFVRVDDREQAWANVALPIDSGQTISQPYIVGLMTQALALSGGERVLEIGTGSGYQAAILARLAAEVISIERRANLAAAAIELLVSLGIGNVEVVTGDGTLGLPHAAPFDGVIITAGAPRVPAPLLAQLASTGGRLVIPVGTLDDQRLYLYQRHGERLDETDLGPVRFVPLLGDSGWSPSHEPFIER